MKRFLIVGSFLALTACANTLVDQSACVTDCQANSQPTPSYSTHPSYPARIVGSPVIYYRPRTMNCVPVGYPPVVQCGYAPH